MLLDLLGREDTFGLCVKPAYIMQGFFLDKPSFTRNERRLMKSIVTKIDFVVGIVLGYSHSGKGK